MTRQMEPRVRWSCVAVGIVLLLCGLGLVLVPALAPTLTTMVVGGVLILAGVVEVVGAAVERGRAWGLSVLVGLVAIAAGGLLLADPSRGLGIGVLIGGYMVLAGPLKLALAVFWRPIPGWRWMLANGFLTIALGLIILAGWPETARWALGVFFGLDLLTAGVALAVHGIGGVSAFGAPEDRMLPS
ncbi:MAG: DUF308 domain-containing protein [Myxococcota bacterium]